jgi:hypothetical protein
MRQVRGTSRSRAGEEVDGTLIVTGEGQGRCDREDDGCRTHRHLRASPPIQAMVRRARETAAGVRNAGRWEMQMHPALHSGEAPEPTVRLGVRRGRPAAHGTAHGSLRAVVQVSSPHAWQALVLRRILAESQSGNRTTSGRRRAHAELLDFLNDRMSTGYQRRVDRSPPIEDWRMAWQTTVPR